jgi:hypothetical protein
MFRKFSTRKENGLSLFYPNILLGIWADPLVRTLHNQLRTQV